MTLKIRLSKIVFDPYRIWQFCLLLIAILLSVFASTFDKPIEPGLIISESSVESGGKDGSPNTQVVSYSVTLQNDEAIPVMVDTVIPVLTGEISKRLNPEDVRVVVEKAINPGDSLGVTGELLFNAKGISGTQINSWGPLITGFKVKTEQILPASP